MLIPNHLVIPESLATTLLEFTGERVIIHARVASATACCPTCQAPSDRVLHSHYDVLSVFRSMDNQRLRPEELESDEQSVGILRKHEAGVSSAVSTG